jgi:hypothetical protein
MRGWPPYEPRDDDNKNPYRPYGSPSRKSPWDDIFDNTDKTMREMRKILSAFLSEDDSKKKMNKMKKRTTLKAKVKRGNKVYQVTVEEITPKPSEIPDEVTIEWDDQNSFGEGHEDLTE